MLIFILELSHIVQIQIMPLKNKIKAFQVFIFKLNSKISVQVPYITSYTTMPVVLRNKAMNPIYIFYENFRFILVLLIDMDQMIE
ncbi:hypothetical protein D3C71_1625230 [compost metagenome]